jgi:hypothetical protein
MLTFLVLLAIVSALCVAVAYASVIHRRRVTALQRWADQNGWSFSRDAASDPSWAGWSAQMIESEVSRMRLHDRLLFAGSVGPVLSGTVDGTAVRPGPRPGPGDHFGDRFRVEPEEACEQIPEELQRAHLAGEIGSWSTRDGRPVTTYAHQYYQWAPTAEMLPPAARVAMHAARLLTGQPSAPTAGS